MEVTLVFTLLAAASLLVAPRLFSGEQAATARKAQSSLELAASAALDIYEYNSTPSSDLTLFEELAPRLSFVDASSPSELSSEISVLASSSSTILAASDEKGFCWGIILSYASSGKSTVYTASETASCTASVFSAWGSPPSDLGGSWSSPWVD